MSAWFERPPAEIQMGNGKLLATFDAFGELEQVFSPHIDALQARLGSFRTLVLFPDRNGKNGDTRGAPGLAPIVPGEFDAELKLARGGHRLDVEYRHRFSSLVLKRRIGVHPTETLLLDSWELGEVDGHPVGLLHQSIPWIGNSTSAHCSLYHPTYNGMVHHRGRRWLGILSRGAIQWVRAGHVADQDRHRMYDGERIFAPIGAHDLVGFPRGPVNHGWDQVVQGAATYGAMAVGPAKRLDFFIVGAESERHLGELHEEIKNISVTRFFQMSEGVVQKQKAPARDFLKKIDHPKVKELVERSIEVLQALQDRTTGALMAAAEVDPASKMSGGYGYSWPRDGAFLAAALGAAGYHDRVEHYLKFLADTQDPSGLWWQRYLATGHAGPSWGRIQIDETASVIMAAAQHVKLTKDLFWLEKNWKMLKRGLDHLEEFHGPDHPLGLPSHDLWEERMGVHAYSLGAVAGAFRAGSFLAGELSHDKLASHYREWSDALKTILIENFFKEDEKIHRSLLEGNWDSEPDASLLGLVFPFEIFEAGDPRAKRLSEMVRTQLWCEGVGGVMRYPGDYYKGGHPWILATLWAGHVEMMNGNLEEAKNCFRWTMSKATEQGMLAEQVHKETGRPFWVIPLAWSHAMLILFVREAIDRGVAAQMWSDL